MDDSDEEYIEYSSGGENFDEGMSRRTRNKQNKTTKKVESNLKGASGGYSWEDEYHRSWDIVQEDAGGSLAGVVAGLVEESKKRRITKDTTPVQRGIIRNLVLVLDLSTAMAEKDLRPNRYALTLAYAIDFVSEFFDQNPISQLGIVGMKDGMAILVSEVDGNPNAHIEALQRLKKHEPRGDPSLQNALEMSRGMLFHVASHCTKEILVVFGALLSSDPGDIHKTIKGLVADKIRAKVIGLAAHLAVCKELVSQTNYGDDSGYGVVLNESHFKELFMETTTPLALNTMNAKESSALVEMGFPSRISETEPTMCACHSKLTQGEYICPRCKAKICSLPMICPCCGLTLILSTHLARSYPHLFPLRAFRHITSDEEAALSTHCFSCMQPFPTHDSTNVSTSKYACSNCNNHFCIDCDVFCHETLHNCPGCESRKIKPKFKPAKPAAKPIAN
ncbi:general transcription and DNA repair factor IIH subunit Ssl1p [Trichomonascus vanleenenianus]|uniref:TFIIH/NER complex subunit SSL1 n=1 Tax=Trichomonascus vanleenenianus TaxID=2268995 RepID=UPI003ECAEE34